MDDIVGVSLVSDVQRDLVAVYQLVRRLFNYDCVEESKTVVGRRIPVLGGELFEGDLRFLQPRVLW